MVARAKDSLYRLLRWSERYTRTDMVYLAYSGFWSNLNAFVIAFFSLLLYIAYAHFLSKETYGTYQYLLSFFSIATAFTLTGMNTAVVRAVALGREETLQASVRVQLRWGALPFLVALGIGGYYFYMGNAMLAAGLAIIALGTPLLYAFNTYGAFLTGKKDFKRQTYYGLASSAVYYAALILAAYLTDLPLIVLAVNLAVQTVLSYVLYRRTLSVYRPQGGVDQEALSYGKHLSFMNAIGSAIGQFDPIFAFHFLGPVALATYSFATAVPERLANIFFKFLGNAALPKFSERSPSEIRHGLMRKMLIAYGVGFFVMLGSMVAVPIFFHLLFPQYLEAVPYAVFYSVGIFIGAAHFLPLSALTALQRTRELYVINVVTPLTQLVFPLVGVLGWGLWGLMAGRLLTTVFAVILSTGLVYYARQ